MRIQFKDMDSLAVLCGLIVCALLDGCASSRVLKAPLPSAAPDLAWTTTSPDGLTVEVDQLIVRDSAGSWVRKANWDEYVVAIKNGSAGPVEIQRIDLYSSKLPAPEESSISREQLDARTSGTMRAFKDAGIIAGVGVAAPAAMIIGGVGTSGALSASTGALALAAAGVILIPIGLIGGTTYVVKRHHRDQQDKVLIDRHLAESGYAVPVSMPPDSQLRKSAFFPITPSPTQLAVRFLANGSSRDVLLDLPGLAGLHLKAQRAKTASIRPIDLKSTKP
ncbi:MAG TPA: hypothetical protein VKG05_03850 [Steroidobacteraceae bacterium]|nr:hypothetical protein [Steroidobacteraceae bacterium]